MSDEDFPVRRKKRFTGKNGVELRKNQLKANQAEKGKIRLEYIFPLRTYRDWRVAAKTVKWFSKYVLKKSNALINRCHFFHCKKNSNIYSNTESAKKMSVEISQRMFSEIMPAFTEMAEMFIMKTKNSEKRALFSIKCSRGALSIVDKIENWKNTKRKKTTSVDEKEKDEVKLHAALLILLSGQFTNLEGIHSAMDVARVSTTEWA